MTGSTNPRLALGKLGEQLAADFLRRHGYQVHETNFRCRHGEMDIVASQGKVLAFVEVRTRAGGAYGTPEESVNERKQRRLRKVADAYLEERYLCEQEGNLPTNGHKSEGGVRVLRPIASPEGEVPVCRIDVVVVELAKNGRVTRIELIRDAVSN